MSDAAAPGDINPGIRRTVALLRAAGFATVDSGDGETHQYDCDRDHGYVVMVAEPAVMVAECRRLAHVVHAAGLVVVPSAMEAPEVGQVTVEGSYSPADDIAILNLSYVHDRMLRPAVPVPSRGGLRSVK